VKRGESKMKKLLFLISLLLISIFLIQPKVTISDTAVQVATGISEIVFVDDLNGWAVGRSGLILHTSNGGLDWSIQTWAKSGDIYSILFDVYFIDKMNGWICGRTSINGTSYGLILHTEDGGNMWKIQYLWEGYGGYYDLYTIYFINETYGFAGGEVKTLFCTKDGGKTWTKVELTEPPWLGTTIHDITFKNNYGWIAGGEGVWYTEDYGKTWHWVYLSSGEIFYRIIFVNTTKGWTFSNFGSIWTTNDGGKTWTKIVSEIGNGVSINGATFYNSTHGWIATGAGDIYNTTDGGLTWNLMKTNSSILWLSIYVNSMGHIYPAGGIFQTGFGVKRAALAIIESHGSGWVTLLGPTITKTVTIDGKNYTITLKADSTMTDFGFDVANRALKLNVFGPNGYQGQCDIIIPKDLMFVPQVRIDGWTVNYTVTEDGENLIIHVTYKHSTHKLEVSPLYTLHVKNMTLQNNYFIQKITLLNTVTHKTFRVYERLYW